MPLLSLSGLPRCALTRPRGTILAGVLVLAAAAPGLPRLTLRTDGYALIPPASPEIQLDRQIRDQFAVQDPLILLIQSNHANGIFNTGTLALVKELTEELRQIDGVSAKDVFSLATEHSHRVYTGTLRFRPFLDPIPESDEDLQRLRIDLRTIGLYSGTLISSDEKATAIMLAIPNRAELEKVVREVRRIIANCVQTPGEIHIIGAPVAEFLLGTHLLEDLGVPSGYLSNVNSSAVNEDGELRWPSSWHELRRQAARIGLVPLALVIMSLVFLLAFRSAGAVCLPLLEIGAALVFVFGLMGWMGVPVYLTIAVLPVVLTAVGVADEVHLFSRYTELLRAHPSEPIQEIVARTMLELTGPMVKSGITTAMGFLAFALSPIKPVQAFGVFTAIGILFCLLWSITVIPAMLRLTKPAGWLRIQRGHFLGEKFADQGSPMPGLLHRVLRRVARHPLLNGLTALALVMAAAIGIQRVRIQDSWIEGFSQASSFRQATDYFNEQFLGTHQLLLRLDTGYAAASQPISASWIADNGVRIPANSATPADLVGMRLRLRKGSPENLSASGARSARTIRPWEGWVIAAERTGEEVALSIRDIGPPLRMFAHSVEKDEIVQCELIRQPLLDPVQLERLWAFETFLRDRQSDEVGGVIGPPDYVRTTYLMSRGLDEQYRRIPDANDRIEWLWQQYGRIRGEERLRQIVDAQYGQTLITVFLKNANFVSTARLMEAVRDYEKTQLLPHGIRVDFGGDVAVSQTLIDSIVTTQTGSLAVSFIGALAVTSLMTRSLLWGILCLVPCATAVMLNFGAMGFAGMPLGVATSMFSAMVIGIGDDFAIHFIERYRVARRRGAGSDEALSETIGITGRAIVLDALAVSLGFGVLIVSQVPANARLGALLVLSMVSCVAGTLLLLPALVRLMPLKVR